MLPLPPLLTLLAPILLTPTLAQLTPSPAYTPPPATSGTEPSSSTPNTQWSSVLGNALWFYDAQRSGNLSAGAYGNRVEWRNDSAMEDGEGWGVDLVGGWWDAGNYIKCTFPLGFTLFALSWGGLSYGPGYDGAQQTAYLDGTLRWGYDWLIKAHPTDDQLFVQVGSSSVFYWGGDEGIPEPRPAYPVNTSAPGTDVWASTSAAFAMGALTYSGVEWNTSGSSYPPASLRDSQYSATLLDHAKRLYSVANSTEPALYADSIPEVGDAYVSSGYGDEMAVAALALAAATNDSSYYADAVAHYTTHKLTGKQVVWNWDSRTPALYVLFAETAAARPQLAQGAGLDANLTGWQAECENYFDAIVGNNLQRGWITSGGLLYYDGDSDQASLNPAIAAAALLLRYAPLATSQDKSDKYTQFAMGQVDYLMGKNPMNVPYMVGLHPNSPKNPHSALASGGDNPNNIRNDPETNVHVLYGAVIGGPLETDRYWDYRDDWVQNEAALDYNANVPAIAAYQLATNASDPYYVTMSGSYSFPQGQPCDAALPCRSGLTPGQKGGIAGGVIGGIIVIAGLVWWQWSWIAGKKARW